MRMKRTSIILWRAVLVSGSSACAFKSSTHTKYLLGGNGRFRPLDLPIGSKEDVSSGAEASSEEDSSRSCTISVDACRHRSGDKDVGSSARVGRTRWKSGLHSLSMVMNDLPRDAAPVVDVLLFRLPRQMILGLR